MKSTLVLVLALGLLLVVPVVLPASHRARRRPGARSRQVPHQHLLPLRIVRSPQAPKVVRPVHHATGPAAPAHPLAPRAAEPRPKA